MSENFPYDDIVNLPHPVSHNHQQMPLANRAAQFAPFAALTGHDAAISETARLTTAKKELSADQLALLSQKLTLVLSHEQRPLIAITYYKPDQRKEGGSYVTIKGFVKKVEPTYNLITLTDGTEIDLDCVSDITGDVFDLQ